MRIKHYLSQNPLLNNKRIYHANTLDHETHENVTDQQPLQADQFLNSFEQKHMIQSFSINSFNINL